MRFEGGSWDEQLRLTAQKAVESAADNKRHNKPIDCSLVGSTVAASEPPRICDVPAHIKFCQKWGGGEKQSLVFETLDFIELNMPSGRIINGPFFDKLAGRNFPPSELVPRMVHACVIAQAIGTKERET